MLFTSGQNLIEMLPNLRNRALRKNVWFATLTNQERVLVGLLRRHVNEVKSGMLAMVVAKIIVKLMLAIKNGFWNKIERIGRPIAEAAGRGASSIGWKDAAKWAEDVNIVRWYGLTYRNCPSYIGVMP